MAVSASRTRCVQPRQLTYNRRDHPRLWSSGEGAMARLAPMLSCSSVDRYLRSILLAFTALLLFSGCAKLTTSVPPGTDFTKLQSFYVIRHERDGREVNVAIRDELSKRGLVATTGPDSTRPAKVDVIVTYEDRWMWDITMYLFAQYSLQRSRDEYAARGRTVLSSFAGAKGTGRDGRGDSRWDFQASEVVHGFSVPWLCLPRSSSSAARSNIDRNLGPRPWAIFRALRPRGRSGSSTRHQTRK